MFEQTPGDTGIGVIEARYGIDLNTRSDTKLANLLAERGFPSLTKLLDAYYQRATSHSRKRRVFPSFHGDDIRQVQGFRLMVSNPNVEIELNEAALVTLVNSNNMPYIRQELAKKISRCEVLVCLIGNGTAWREMVEWEIKKAMELGKGVCGVRLKDSRGRAPDVLRENGFPVASWDIQQIVAAIECAAARRS